MAFAEEEAKRQGSARVILYTNEKMTENIGFYEKLGYKPYARLPHPTRENAWQINMEKAV
jgi:GNAT superfamily N-acetyltransferase